MTDLYLETADMAAAAKRTTTPPQRGAHIVLIDDDSAMAAMLSTFLASDGFTVTHESTAVHGLRTATQPDVQLVLLDVVLPDSNGFDLLHSIRALSRVPVIMLTIQNEVERRVFGLESGADDYVAKPFSPAEVVARIRSVLRRRSADPASADNIVVDDLQLSASSHTVRKGTQVVACTPAEFSVLQALMKKPGMPIGKEDLTRLALGRSSYAGDRGVDNLVHSLRRKLGARLDDGERFRAVRNQGYVYLHVGAHLPGGMQK